MILSSLSSALLLAAASLLASPTASDPTAAQVPPAFSAAPVPGPASGPRVEAASSPARFAPTAPAPAPQPVAATPGGVFEIPNMPLPNRIDRVWAFNFVSSTINEIDGSSAGNAAYTAWDFGFGSKWNNLRSRPITAAAGHPLPGDGAFSLDGQGWLEPFSGQGVLLEHMVNTVGAPQPGMRVVIDGSFSMYNTGGSPYGNPAGGVPPGWDYFQKSNVGSMGLSHLWLDGRFWNDTDITAEIRVTDVPNGTYLLVCWLNPSNHDPLRSGRVTTQGQTFQIDHSEGADYSAGNRTILANLKVRDEPLSFRFHTFAIDGINADSSLAGFALMRLRE